MAGHGLSDRLIPTVTEVGSAAARPREIAVETAQKAAQAVVEDEAETAAYDPAAAQQLFEAKCSQCHETSLVAECPARFGAGSSRSGCCDGRRGSGGDRRRARPDRALSHRVLH